MDIVEILFVALLILIFTIVKAIPFGVLEIIGYSISGLIYGPTVGTLIFLPLIFLVPKFIFNKIVNSSSIRIIKFVGFFLMIILNSYIMGWIYHKIGLDNRTAIQSMQYPYHWIGALVATAIQFKLLYSLDK